MAYNLRRGRIMGDEEQPPPPPPTPAELMQTIVESQRMLAEAMRPCADFRRWSALAWLVWAVEEVVVPHLPCYDRDEGYKPSAKCISNEH